MDSNPSLLHIKFESKFSKMILSKESLLCEGKGFCNFLKINRKNSLTCWQKTLGEPLNIEMNLINSSTPEYVSTNRKRKISSEEQDNSLANPEPNKYIKTEIIEPVEEAVIEPPKIKEEPIDVIEPEPALFAEPIEHEPTKTKDVKPDKPMKTENVKPEIMKETPLFNDLDDEDLPFTEDVPKSIKTEDCSGDETHKISVPDKSIELEDEPKSLSLNQNFEHEDLPKSLSLNQNSELEDLPKSLSLNQNSELEDVPKSLSLNQNSELEDVPKSIKIEDCSGDGTHKISVPEKYFELEDEVILFSDEILKLVLDTSKFPHDNGRPICDILEDYWRVYKLPKICTKCNNHKVVVDATFRLFVSHFLDKDSVEGIYNNMAEHMVKHDFQDVMVAVSQEVLRLKELQNAQT